MALSGRAALLVFAGLIPLVVWGRSAAVAWAITGAWLIGCALIFVIDAMLAASPRKMGIERRVTPRIRLGETAKSELFLTNLGTRRMRALVRDCWEPSAAARPSRAEVTLPPHERRVLSTTLQPFRRGTRRTARIAVRSFGPLGLGARQITLESAGSVRVVPPFLSRRHLPSRVQRLREIDGRASLMVRGQGTEFDSLRDYVEGDDVRSIDWRATARRQDLVVRTWRPERDRRVIIVIDTGRLSAARIDDQTRLDTAIETAFLVSALADQAGDRVSVLALDRRERARVTGASGSALSYRIADQLADVEPQLIDVDWGLAVSEIDQMSRQRALVILVTPVESIGSSAGLIGRLPELTRTHRVVIAAVDDPQTMRFADTAETSAEAYRSGSAATSLNERSALESALGMLGAGVVSASPEKLAAAVADRYLDLKAQGKL